MAPPRNKRYSLRHLPLSEVVRVSRTRNCRTRKRLNPPLLPISVHVYSRWWTPRTRRPTPWCASRPSGSRRDDTAHHSRSAHYLSSVASIQYPSSCQTICVLICSLFSASCAAHDVAGAARGELHSCGCHVRTHRLGHPPGTSSAPPRALPGPSNRHSRPSSSPSRPPPHPCASAVSRWRWWMWAAAWRAARSTA